jgi:hypothetical protein
MDIKILNVVKFMMVPFIFVAVTVETMIELK